MLIDIYKKIFYLGFMDFKVTINIPTDHQANETDFSGHTEQRIDIRKIVLKSHRTITVKANIIKP